MACAGANAARLARAGGKRYHVRMKRTETTNRHTAIIVVCGAIFAFILFAVQRYGWWMADMAGGFFLMGIAALVHAVSAAKPDQH